MKTALETIERVCADCRPVVAFSGGCDSQVLLHLIYTRTEHRPPAVFVNTGLLAEYEEPDARAFAEALGAEFHVGTPKRNPLAQWLAQGWPILGPLPARQWTAKNKHLGIRLNCEACCRRLKIMPGRELTRALGCNAQFTGIRASDDQQRFHRLRVGGNIQQGDGLVIAHPIAHWTDLMVRRYRRAHSLPNPRKNQMGQVSSGCEICAGGWRFERNALSQARRIAPERWRWFLVDCEAWLPLLVVKTGKPPDVVREAVARLGGPERLIEDFPETFDYAQRTPKPTYAK